MTASTPLKLLLTRSGTQNVDYLWLGAYRLRVDVSDPTGSGADPNIFIYNQRPVNPYDGTVLADFMGVCSPADFAEYPVGEPRAGTTYPFFRLPYVELDFRGASQGKEAWVKLIYEADHLLCALNALTQLQVMEEVLVEGCAQPVPYSSSSSGS